MPKTNVHVHVFTADQSPEIQFFYMLWSVFEATFVRRGVVKLGPFGLGRFRVGALARASWGFRLLLWLGKHTPVGETFNGSLAGLVRIVTAMSRVDEATILQHLGMASGISGRAFLGFLLDRLREARRWDDPNPLDRVLAAIAHDLYSLHERVSAATTPITQAELLERFYAKGPGDGKADYERVVLLTVNFDCAFLGLDKYGLDVTPRYDFAAQVDDLRSLAADPALRQRIEALAGHPVELRPFLCVDPRYEPPGGLDAWVHGLVDREHGPFYGIKLYPPMGFRPTDPRLRSVLAWCKERSIPICAHCAQGGAGLRGLEERGDYAHPRHWRYLFELLQGPGTLRLNLAHFSDLTRSIRIEAAQTWSDEIIGLMNHCSSHRPDIELYSDIAYLCPKSDRKAFERNVRLIHRHGLERFLLFGSDWWNYLPDCEDEQAYLRDLGMLDSPPTFDPAVLEANANRFLG